MTRPKTMHGVLAEAQLVGRIGGRQVPGGGTIGAAKGDVEAGPFLIESKATVHLSASVRLDWLAKITGQAMHKGRVPALAIQFTDHKGHLKKGGGWVMIREAEFKDLLCHYETIHAKEGE